MDSRLEGLVRQSIAAFCGTPPDRLGELHVTRVHQSDREIYRVTAERREGAFALKVRGLEVEKEGDLDEDASRLEYEKLQKANAAARRAGNRLELPVPLGYFPAHKAILTTWCDGRELRRLYYAGAWRWPVSRGYLRRCFRDCGDWLGRFHRASSRDADAGDIARHRLAHVERMRRQVAEHPGNSLSAARLANLCSGIEAGLTASARTQQGFLHGNFTLRNVLVLQKGVAPVDFEDSREDALALDAGQFLADILLSGYRPLIWQAAREGAATGFLKAYSTHIRVDPRHLGAYTLYHLLAAYYEVLLRAPRGLAPSVLASHQARVFARLLRRPDEVAALRWQPAI